MLVENGDATPAFDDGWYVLCLPSVLTLSGIRIGVSSGLWRENTGFNP